MKWNVVIVSHSNFRVSFINYRKHQNSLIKKGLKKDDALDEDDMNEDTNKTPEAENNNSDEDNEEEEKNVGKE